MSADITHIDEQGIRWAPFSVLFDTQEGQFTFELWAVDEAHAMERLEELKATARLGGRVVVEVKA